MDFFYSMLLFRMQFEHISLASHKLKSSQCLPEEKIKLVNTQLVQ
jgi:hypothetical protein